MERIDDCQGNENCEQYDVPRCDFLPGTFPLVLRRTVVTPWRGDGLTAVPTTISNFDAYSLAEHFTRPFEKLSNLLLHVTPTTSTALRKNITSFF
jgi:hypothetical protein